MAQLFSPSLNVFFKNILSYGSKKFRGLPLYPPRVCASSIYNLTVSSQDTDISHFPFYSHACQQLFVVSFTWYKAILVPSTQVFRTSLLPLLPVSSKFNKTVVIFPMHLFLGKGVIVFTNNSIQPFQTLLFKKSRYFVDQYIFILTWQERHHDHKGGFPRARLIHCMLDALTLRFPQMQETRLIMCGSGGLSSHSRLKGKRKRKLIYIFSTKIFPYSQTTVHLHVEPRSHLWAKVNLTSLLFLHCYFEDKGCLHFCSSMYLLFDVRLRTYLHIHSFI